LSFDLLHMRMNGIEQRQDLLGKRDSFDIPKALRLPDRGDRLQTDGSARTPHPRQVKECVRLVADPRQVAGQVQAGV